MVDRLDLINASNGEASRSKSKRKLDQENTYDYLGISASIKDDDKTSLLSHATSLSFPPELEEEFAAALFEYGLKQSSPKILISLMPQFPGLNTEHIKSHLQKYRIHNDRSKLEFVDYYREHLRGHFLSWLTAHANNQRSQPLNKSTIDASADSGDDIIVPGLNI